MAKKMSTCYLCSNAKVDPSFNNALRFKTKEEQVAYFRSCAPANHIFQNVLYINKQGVYVPLQNTIRVALNAEELRDTNYLIYQNEGTDKKWFFAFVSEIVYINENCTEIKFIIDAWQTYQFDITFNSCFIEREHTLTDEIGEHPEEEGIDTGEFITETENDIMDSLGGTYLLTDYWVLFSLNYGYSSLPYTVEMSLQGALTGESYIFPDSIKQVAGGQVVNGMFTGSTYIAFPISNNLNIDNINDFIRKMTEKGQVEGKISSVSMVPYWLVNDWVQAEIKTPNIDGVIETWSIKGAKMPPPGSSGTPNVAKAQPFTVEVPFTYIDGYLPKCNKMYNGEYRFLEVDNNQGTIKEYDTEYFKNNEVKFMLEGAIAAQSTLRLVPVGYKTNLLPETSPFVTKGGNYQEAVDLTGYPLCSFAYSAYANSIGGALNATTNAQAIGNVELSRAALKSVSKIGAAAALTGGTAAVAVAAGELFGALSSGIDNLESATQSLAEGRDRARAPTTTKGTNNSNISIADGTFTFTLRLKSIRRVYAEKIDNFLWAFGYKVNRYGKPLFSRPYWNFIKTSGCSIRGNIPFYEQSSLNSIFNKGCTFWEGANAWMNYENNNRPIKGGVTNEQSK